MSNQPGTLETIARHLALAVRPLRDGVADLDAFRRLMYRLGWNVQSLPASYQELGTLVEEALTTLSAIEASPDEADISTVLTLLDKVRAIYRGIADLTEAPAGVDANAFLEEITERLFELLLIDYLAAAVRPLYEALATIGIISFEAQDATEDRPPSLRPRLRTERVRDLINDPLSLPRIVYGWGEDRLDTTTLFSHLREVLEHTGAVVSFGRAPVSLVEGYVGAGTSPSCLRLKVFETTIAEEAVEIAFLLLPLPAEGQQKPGLILQPAVPPDLGVDREIAEGLHLRIRPNVDLSSLFGIVIRPGELSVRYPFQPGTELPALGFGLAVEYKPDTTALLLGSPTASRLVLQGATSSLDLDFRQGELELRLGLSLNGLALVLGSQDQDGFLRKLIGEEEATISLPLTIQWSSQSGIAFAGGGGLSTSVVPHLEIGPVVIERVEIAINSTVTNSAPPDLRVTLGASVTGKLGSLTFAVNGIGVSFALIFKDGNAGPFDIKAGFKPPNALGLSIDGGGFKGGGFLGFDPEEALYSGMLELEFQDQFTLKAFALLNTRLPNGQSGFSLLIIISAEFTPIQLGLGFKLNGVGGLLGLNRTINIEPLRAGLRANTLNSILFPTDVVANADRIISDLKQIFPPMVDRFIFGPMAKIAWGTPTLVTVDLGLVIEIPDPVRLLILGVLRAVLPDERAAILQVQVNFLGEINFERRQLKFDASLFDSKLLGFNLSGDMAIRLDWGADANFLLTVGGFHPAYEPPPMDLPAIRRLTLALLSGDNPRLRLEMYFAVTSNTAQFGAKLELHASASAFNVYGTLSFDVLFQFNPFYFIAEITAMLALRIGSSSFASIKLTLTLEGPTPWKAKGTAQFKICWFFTLKVRFNKTFGETRNTTLPDLAVLPLLAEALRADDNWEGELPARRHRLESIREAPELAGELLLHPIGTLKISQKVVPLNVAIDRIGSQRPSDGREFRIVNPQPAVTSNTPQEAFAPAQFFDLTDEQKLTSASFKDLDSGIRVGDAAQLHTGYAAARVVEYEVKYIDSQRDQRLAPPRGTNVFDVDAGAFNTWTLQGAIAQSQLSFARQRKSSLAPEAVVVSQEPFAIVNSGDLQLFDASSLLGSEHAAVARLNELMRTNPNLRGTLQVVPAFELAA